MSGDDKDKQFQPTSFFGIFRNNLYAPQSMDELNQRSLRARANVVHWMSRISGTRSSELAETFSGRYNYFWGKSIVL